jgi:hypothetical protein
LLEAVCEQAILQMEAEVPFDPCDAARLVRRFLLGLVLHLATRWVSVSPEFEAAIDVPTPGNAPGTSRTLSVPCSASPPRRHEHVAPPQPGQAPATEARKAAVP